MWNKNIPADDGVVHDTALLYAHFCIVDTVYPLLYHHLAKHFALTKHNAQWVA